MKNNNENDQCSALSFRGVELGVVVNPPIFMARKGPLDKRTYEVGYKRDFGSLMVLDVWSSL